MSRQRERPQPDAVHPVVAEPIVSARGCWAQKRTGQPFPAYANCGKTAREGHLTCQQHGDHEEAAQRRKAFLTAKRQEWSKR
jgi:hypothetical protein